MHDSDRNNGSGNGTHSQGTHYQAVAALGRVAEMQALIIERLITPQPSILPVLLQMMPTILQMLGSQPKVGGDAATTVGSAADTKSATTVAAA